MTYEDYRAEFDSLSDAEDFENEILNSDEELPMCAAAVLCGDLPTSAYWEFLLAEYWLRKLETQ